MAKGIEKHTIGDNVNEGQPENIYEMILGNSIKIQ